MTTCSNVINIDYTDDIVKLDLVNGLADEEIWKEVLEATEIDNKTLSETVALLDGKETAPRAGLNESPKIAASSYKRMARGQTNLSSPVTTHDHSEQDKLKRKIRCQCGHMTSQFGKVRGKLKEFQTCPDCWKKNRQRIRTSRQPESSGPMEAMFHYVATAETVLSCPPPSVSVARGSDRGTVSIPDHFVFDSTQQWRSSEAWPHPTLTLKAAVDSYAYRKM